MAEEVEIHPGAGATAFGATQHAAIKVARGIEIGNVKGEMKEATHALKNTSAAGLPGGK